MKNLLIAIALGLGISGGAVAAQDTLAQAFEVTKPNGDSYLCTRGVWDAEIQGLRLQCIEITNVELDECIGDAITGNLSCATEEVIIHIVDEDVNGK